MNHETMPTTSDPSVPDPKELAGNALAVFPSETFLWEKLAKNPELLKTVDETLDGVEFDPDVQLPRAEMFARIHTELHGRAGHGIRMESGLNTSEAKTEAVDFIKNEIKKYEKIIEALEADNSL